MFRYKQKLGEFYKLAIIVVIVLILGLGIGGYALVNTTNFKYRLSIQLKDWFNFESEFIKD